MSRPTAVDPASRPAAAVLDRSGLDALVDVLRADGYRVIGPTVRDDAIVLAELRSGADLPAGRGVETSPGRYRLVRREDAAVFAHSAGAQSWKQFVHPPRRTLWTEQDGRYVPGAAAEDCGPYAFLGVRGCDLAALGVLRSVLTGGRHPDASFTGRTERLLVIAVGCTEPGGVCFCASMGTGPAPGPGYDLALTERIDGAGHRFVVEIGTDAGGRVLEQVRTRAATPAEVDDARHSVESAAARMGRRMPDVDLRALLVDSRESAHWSEVAGRCVHCGNCTMVCPTCFCTTTEDHTTLTADPADAQVGRSQRWSSCFETDFSYVHGGSVRVSPESRYRQWMTHKLSAWYDQFGTSGCVGCGRCIAWCPTGIDITAEAAALAGERDRDAGR